MLHLYFKMWSDLSPQSLLYFQGFWDSKLLNGTFHGEKTLKTTIHKNFSKSQKFAREVPVAAFRYSQIIFSGSQ